MQGAPKDSPQSISLPSWLQGESLLNPQALPKGTRGPGPIKEGLSGEERGHKCGSLQIRP